MDIENPFAGGFFNSSYLHKHTFAVHEGEDGVLLGKTTLPVFQLVDTLKAVT